jgi:hypothetical protein
VQAIRYTGLDTVVRSDQGSDEVTISRLTGAALVAALAVAVASGCGSARPKATTPKGIDPSDFTATIDNPYWPMAPRTRWTTRESDAEGASQKVVVTVTDTTRRIANGVTARVVRDSVTEHGQVIEDTFDFYAQDTKGNVWYLGEQTAEFEGGKVATRAGSWEAGVHGARPGIVMPAAPRAGMRYRQEFDPGNAQDTAEVLSTHEMVQAPYGWFGHALLTRETTPLEPKVLEYKLYARGVGPVLALGVSGEISREALVKVDRADRAFAHAAGTAPLGHPPA